MKKTIDEAMRELDMAVIGLERAKKHLVYKKKLLSQTIADLRREAKFKPRSVAKRIPMPTQEYVAIEEGRCNTDNMLKLWRDVARIEDVLLMQIRSNEESVSLDQVCKEVFTEDAARKAADTLQKYSSSE